MGIGEGPNPHFRTTPILRYDVESAAYVCFREHNGNHRKLYLSFVAANISKFYTPRVKDLLEKLVKVARRKFKAMVHQFLKQLEQQGQAREFVRHLLLELDGHSLPVIQFIGAGLNAHLANLGIDLPANAPQIDVNLFADIHLTPETRAMLNLIRNRLINSSMRIRNQKQKFGL